MKDKTQMLTLHINGKPVDVRVGSSVAAALCIADVADANSLGITRRSVKGQPRAPFCGMGICQECRVMIDGRRQLACQICCTPGMRVRALQ